MNHKLMFTAAAAAGALAAAPAFAQDINWTGFYVGANVGGDWGDTSLDRQVTAGSGTIVIPPADVAFINQTAHEDANKSGFTAGVQGGYNWQSGNLVLGIETDIGFMDIDQNRKNSYQTVAQTNPPTVPTPTVTLEQRVQANWIWTIRPRVGFASGPWLIYGTAGLAVSNIDLDTSYSDNRLPPNSVTVHSSDTKTGWAAGLGGAWAFTENWSVRGEWLYADFSSIDHTVTTPNGFVSVKTEANAKANLLRLGVDYRF